MSPADRADVLVVGAGPAGLGAAAELRALGVARVVVVDREAELGGVPRHTAHLGYGVRDLHRVLTGPAYAARLVQRAQDAGAELLASTTATDLRDTAAGIVASLDAAGRRFELTVGAVVVATGTRERPRAARLVAGDRPAGVYTTGALQQLVRAGRFSGERAVVVGAEHVSFSAVMTLRHAGCRTVALVTSEAGHQTMAPLAWEAALRHVPVWTGSTVTAIRGSSRVEGVELVDAAGLRTVACDTVVFSGDWVPDHELVRRCGFEVDARSGVPGVDAGFRLDRPGWFAVGNVIHGAESADMCALKGRRAARSIAAWIRDPRAAAWPRPGVPVALEAPLLWASPNRLRPGDDCPGDRILLRIGAVASPLSNRHVTEPGRPGGGGLRHVTIRQGARELWSGRVRGPAGPNRNVSVPVRGWLGAVRLDDPAPITIRIA